MEERKMYALAVCGFLLLQHVLWAGMTKGASSVDFNRAARIKRAPVYSCGRAILAGRGNITSPGFPVEYPKHALCHWTVEPRDLTRPIRLSFESFDVESDRVCTYDSLFIIRDKAENNTYCNGNEPPVEGLVGRHFDLTFTSDAYGHEQHRGFLISYSPADIPVSTPVSTVAVGKTWAKRTTNGLPTTSHPEVLFSVPDKVTSWDRNVQTNTNRAQNISAWFTDTPTVGTEVSSDIPELGTVPSRMFTAKETIIGGFIIGIIPLSCAVILLGLYLRRTRERDTVAAIIQAITLMDEAIVEMEESVALGEDKDGTEPTEPPGQLKGSDSSSQGGRDNTPGDLERSVDSQGHTNNEEGSSLAVTQPIAKDAGVQSNNVAATSGQDEWMSYHPISNKMKINVKHTKISTSSEAGNDRSDEETERERNETNGRAESQHKLGQGDHTVVRPMPQEVFDGTARVMAESSRMGSIVKELSRMFKDQEDELCRSTSLPSPMLHPQRPEKLSSNRLDMFDSLERSNSDTSSSDTSLNCSSFDDGSKVCKEWSFSTEPRHPRSSARGDPDSCGATITEGPYDTPRRSRSRGYPDGKEDMLSKHPEPHLLPAKVYKRNVYTKTTVSDKVSLPNGDIEHVTVSSEEDYTSRTSHDNAGEDVSISIRHETTEIVKLFEGGYPETTVPVEKYRTFDENFRSTTERQFETEKRKFSTSPKQAACSNVSSGGPAYGKNVKTFERPERKLNDRSPVPSGKSEANASFKSVGSFPRACDTSNKDIQGTAHTTDVDMRTELSSYTTPSDQSIHNTQFLTQDTELTRTFEPKHTIGDISHADASNVAKKAIKFRFPPSRDQLLEQKSRLRKVVINDKSHKTLD
uniref:CUB domain-containing protein n=1 Tax=Branchiostoma floridae TaxID=7739 RepID=C3YIQ2_BRAFL|eukprot:XP_002603765.1 hypothetical protein BRAFLDRAFT_86593 [Branchiostoma floridae]